MRFTFSACTGVATEEYHEKLEKRRTEEYRRLSLL